MVQRSVCHWHSCPDWSDNSVIFWPENMDRERKKKSCWAGTKLWYLNRVLTVRLAPWWLIGFRAALLPSLWACLRWQRVSECVCACHLLWERQRERENKKEGWNVFLFVIARDIKFLYLLCRQSRNILGKANGAALPCWLRTAWPV